MKYPVLDFYRGKGTDQNGRTIDKVWKLSDGDLELDHDYIQWLFPLQEPSKFNPDAPLLDAWTARKFHTDVELLAKVLTSFKLMLKFYGLDHETVGNSVWVFPSKVFQECARAWVTPNNHNFLRLTRIMTSTYLLGLDDHAIALKRYLTQGLYPARPTVIGQETQGYWLSAISDG